MSRICPKCDTPHQRPGIYCSRSCANSRTFSAEAIAKKSQARLKFNAQLDEAGIQQLNSRMEQRAYDNVGRHLSEILTTAFDDLKYHNKRTRVIAEQNFACGCCGLDTWLEEPLTLELEHIDGNHDNNIRHNLVALCPNCHSLSFSWRGRKNTASPSKKLERQRLYMSKLNTMPQ